MLQSSCQSAAWQVHAGLGCHGRSACAEAVRAAIPAAESRHQQVVPARGAHSSRPLVLRCGPQQPCTSLAFTRSSRPLATSSAPPCMRRTRWCMQLVRSSRPLVLRCCLEQQRTSTEATDAGTTTIFVGVGARSGGIRSCGWFSRISSPPWQSPSGLHQDQSSCDAAGCAIGSRSAAARAPRRTCSSRLRCHGRWRVLRP